MAAPLRFYFDFVSTFSYIAIQRIDALAGRYGRDVDWRVLSLGHLLQFHGITPPPSIPAKFAYMSRDFARSCADAGLPCRMPSPFPFDAKFARLAFWQLKRRDEALSHDFARVVSAAVYGQGASISTVDDLAKACASLPSIARDDLAKAAEDGAAKQALIAALEEAKADGVIGAPFIIVDGEPFWGADRLDHVERFLRKAA
jgi:2-hydroxychromene-2-carboxylate isomerase